MRKVVPQAGAIALRERKGAIEAMVVRARKDPSKWIFPKGHIERGETAKAAAVRELQEEAGVDGSADGVVGVSTFRSGKERVEVRFYLVRYRRKLIEAQAAERNRLLRLLEMANIKLASVMSDVFGVSGRAMLKALIAGSAAPEEMAALARGQLRRKRAELIEALTGGIEEHHRFLLAMQLGRIEAIEADVAALDAQIGEMALLTGFTHQVARVAEPAQQPRALVWKQAHSSAPMKL
jgi:8-oxo-dGTP pyrophosphatase MutT (NUDIX family)